MLTIPHILVSVQFRLLIHQTMESIMPKSILILLTTLCLPAIYGVSYANPTHAEQTSIEQKDIHKNTNYWMHLWEERLRDEYSHVQNNMSTVREYNHIKDQLYLRFTKQYGHDLKHDAYQKIRSLRQEGVLTQADEQKYSSFIINTEIKLHDNG